jgi:hypothetical protein
MDPWYEYWYVIAFAAVVLTCGFLLSLRTNHRLSIAWTVYAVDQLVTMMMFPISFFGYFFLKITIIWVLFQITFIEKGEGKDWPRWPVRAIALEVIALLLLPTFFISAAGYDVIVFFLSSLAIINLLVATIQNLRKPKKNKDTSSRKAAENPESEIDGTRYKTRALKDSFHKT